jgi:hypothetical protein
MALDLFAGIRVSDERVLDEIGAELDAIHREVRDDLGAQDEAYIRRLIAIHETTFDRTVRLL